MDLVHEEVTYYTISRWWLDDGSSPTRSFSTDPSAFEQRKNEASIHSQGRYVLLTYFMKAHYHHSSRQIALPVPY